MNPHWYKENLFQQCNTSPKSDNMCQYKKWKKVIFNQQKLYIKIIWIKIHLTIKIIDFNFIIILVTNRYFTQYDWLEWLLFWKECVKCDKCQWISYKHNI